MSRVCQINLRSRKELYMKIFNFAKYLKENLPVKKIFLYGSFARGDIHEGSDIDLIIIGDFNERFLERIGRIYGLTDLPIEPLVYTEGEFQKMLQNRNPFLTEVLKYAIEL